MQGNRRAKRREAIPPRMAAFFVLLMIGASGIAGRPSLAQEEEVITQGRVYYQQYCASCHGRGAKGDGPLAPELTVKPADLTQISKKSGGEFPQWRVYRVIKGQEEIQGHGSREMPIWGTQFKIEIQEENADTRAFRVVGRILVLVQYLRSIQEQ